MSIVIPDTAAVLALDPGETTGVAAALLNLKRASTTKGLMRRVVEKRMLKVQQVTGSPEDQAWELFELWKEFVFLSHIENGVPRDAVVLVIEAFQLRQRDANLAPVEIIGALKALLRGPSFGRDGELTLWGWGRPVFQTPSQAMGYATNDRLKDWGIWTVAQEHGRDATRHLALRASKLLQGED